MSRISKRFEELKAKGEGALVTFIAAGDPNLDATVSQVRALERGGADVVELGIPFSDPLADGPANQAAYQRALDSGTTIAGILAAVVRIRADSQVPLVLMSYFNPILRFGLDEFARESARAGVDGILITDLPPEEAGEWKRLAGLHGLDTIFLLAPTSTDERIGLVCRIASGFIYCVARTGVTGKRTDLDLGVKQQVERIRAHTQLPIVVGFGIAAPEDVSRVIQWGDGAVVGSAIVERVAKSHGRPEGLEGLVGLEGLEEFVHDLKAATIGDFRTGRL